MADGDLLVQAIFFVGFLSLVLALATWSIGLLIFRPFYETTAVFHVNAKVRLSDLIILAIEIQLLLALFSRSFFRGEFNIWLLFAFVAGILVLFWWVCGIRMLARGGIEATGARWLALGLLIPFGYLSVLLLMMSAVVVPMFFTLSVIAAWERHDLAQPGLLGPVTALVAALLAIGINRKSRSLVLDARRLRAEQDGVIFVGDSPVANADSQSSDESRYETGSEELGVTDD